MTRRGCEVHAFDPSLRQMGMGQGHAVHRQMRSAGIHFHDFGLGGLDLSYPPGTSPWVWPGVGYGREQNTQEWDLRTLESAMRRLRHAGPITVFKADIEGAEWAVLERLMSDRGSRERMRSGRLVRQFLIEAHFLPHGPGGLAPRHPRDAADVDAFNAHAADLLGQLPELGFALWHHDVNTGAPRIGGRLPSMSTCHELYYAWRGAEPQPPGGPAVHIAEALRHLR